MLQNATKYKFGSRILIFVLTISFSCTQKQKGTTIDKFCSYNPGMICGDKFELNFYELSDASEIKKIIYDVMKELGINKKVYIGKFNDKTTAGIFFKLSSDNVARVLVSQKYLDSKWTALGILFHELGHYVNDHENFCSNIELELDADYYAGYCLSKAGADREEAMTSLDILPEIGDDSHPSKMKRKARVLQGWDDQKKSVGITSFVSNKEQVSFLTNENLKKVEVYINQNIYTFKLQKTAYTDSILNFSPEDAILYIKATNSTYQFLNFQKQGANFGDLLNNKTSLVYVDYPNTKIYDQGIIILNTKNGEYKREWTDSRNIDSHLEFQLNNEHKDVVCPDYIYNLKERRKAYPAYFR